MSFADRTLEIRQKAADIRTIGVEVDDLDYYKGNQNYTSASALKKLLNNGNLHFDKYITYGQKPTEALFFGNVVHKMILEPELFHDTYIVFDESYIIKNLSKEYSKPKASKEFKEALAERKKSFAQENAHTVEDLIAQGINNPSGRIVIPKEWKEQAEQMFESIHKVPQAMEIINNSVKELAYFSEINGVKVKSKIDMVLENQFSDLKTTKDVPNFKNVQSAMYKTDLDLSMATYAVQTGCSTASFIFVEKTFPYTVGLYYISEDTMNRGLDKLESALSKYQQFMTMKQNNNIVGHYSGLI